MRFVGVLLVFLFVHPVLGAVFFVILQAFGMQDDPAGPIAFLAALPITVFLCQKILDMAPPTPLYRAAIAKRKAPKPTKLPKPRKPTFREAREVRDAAYRRALAVAEQEVNKGQQNPDVWAEALVKAKGDEARRKVEYMQLRARVLCTQLERMAKTEKG